MQNVLERIGIALIVLGLMHDAQAQSVDLSNLTAGAKIEVREGDTWSAASFVKKEGRRYLIKYDGADAIEEWVTVDRMRVPGTAGTPAPVTPTTPAATPPASPAAAAPAAANTAPKRLTWNVGQKVDVKWGGGWFNATVRRKQGDWYLCSYDGWSTSEWIEYWRIRRIGATEDNIGHARPNPSIRTGEPPGAPPRQDPGAPSEPFGSRRNRPSAAQPSSPANTETAPAPAEESAPEVDPYRTDPTFKKADPKGAAQMNLVVESSGAFAADASPNAALATRAIPLPRLGDGPFIRVLGIAMPRGNGKIAFVHVADQTPGQSSDIRVDKVNVGQGAPLATYQFNSDMTLDDSSPDGMQLALHSTADKGRVEIWSAAAESPRRTLIFYPYEDVQDSSGEVAWARFLDSTNLLTLSTNGTLMLWNLETVKAIYSCNIEKGSTPAVSANTKYLAVPAGALTMILDAKTGKAVAELSGNQQMGTPAYEFSPSGARVASWSRRTICVWDIATGKIVGEFTVPEGGDGILMTSDDYALAGGQYLLDIPRRIILWNYTGIAGAQAMGPDNRVWFSQKDPNRKLQLLSAMPMPDPEAIKAAGALDPEKLSLLKPGVSVSLNINVGNNEERQRIIQSMTKQLTDAGMKIADGQPIRIVASVQDGKSEEREYRRFGRSPFEGGEKVTVTPKITKVTIEHEGKVAWETSTTSYVGFSLQMKEGQSIQQSIQEANQPNPRFVENVTLPTNLPMPKDPPWYGTSEVKSTAPSAQ